MNVENIQSPQDLKTMSIDELEELCEEIRHFLVHSISKTGGHLSSNLGVVELTVALHYVFDSPKDKIIFDVGHQSYVHKILTGRAKSFNTLRQYQGLSGFQKRNESEHDVWEAGHSSTSLSAALGFAVARDLNHEDFQVIPVIGDGALGGGMSFEALNQIGCEQRRMIIVFNDNDMSISHNVGALSNVWTHLRTSKGYTSLKRSLTNQLSGNKAGDQLLSSMRSVKNNIKSNVVENTIFSEMGLDYIGPIDGHNLNELIKTFEVVKNHEGPIVVHVITQKGKGYSYAENDIDGKWHGVGKFNVSTGQPLSMLPPNHLPWSAIMSESLLRLAKENKDIVAITPAMSYGSCLERFKQALPKRFFDCGIAEEHAMTFAASLAQNGKRPFISVYSSFLQRCYDQINHDVARMDLPVVISVDRAGLVGEDGSTHQGVFDVSMLYSTPNLIICQPKDSEEAQDLLYTAFSQNHPCLIRIPKGNAIYHAKRFEKMEIGSWTCYANGDPCVTVITYGQDVDRIVQKAKINELPIQVVNARFLKPLDEAMLERLLIQGLPIITYENEMLHGGLSSAILEFINDHGYTNHIVRMGIQDHFVEHGSLPQLRKQEQIDLDTLFKAIQRFL